MTDALATPNTTELELILGELERLHERCERGLVLQSEIGAILADLDRRARSALPEGTDLFRLYDSRMGWVTDWWRETIGRYVSPVDCPNVGRRISLMRQVLQEIKPEFLRAEQVPKTQLYFTAGEVYRARQEFYRLLRRATTRLDIADPYLNPDVFDFIDALDSELAVRLLTGDPKPLFLQQLHILQASRASLEARGNNQHHDRFVILDGVVVWHLGASINGLGRKAFMVNRVTEASETSKVVADFESWWIGGTAV